jgi:hypothetical protein
VALRLRSNGAPLSGALFVSNPRKRKTSRKARRKTARKTARKRNVSARKAAPKRNRRNTAAAKARRTAALKALRNRRNARKVTRNRRNALAMKANRRNRRNTPLVGTAANRRRTTKRRMTKRNRRNTAPKRNMVRRTRRNTNAVSAFGNRIAAPIQRIVGKVPVIGSIAKQFVAPLVVGAAAGAVHYYGVKALQRYAPNMAEKIQPVQFTVAGSLVAGILLTGGKIPVLKKVSAKTRQQIAAAALILGGGLDTYRFLSSKMGDLGDSMPLYDYSGLGVDLGDSEPLYDYSGLGVDLGDGGAYDVVPLGALAFDGDAIDYSGAEFSDALAAPDDLSVEEGEAALGGAAHYAAAFGPCPVTRTRRGGMSGLAGRPGHRFGWLIKLVGFDRFQKIAALPPEQRVALIQQMKQQSMALADQQKVEEQASSLSGLGVDLGDLGGLGMEYGAHMHAGSVF